jgi:hypothetical protein
MLIAASSWNLGDTLGAVSLVLTVLVAVVVYRRQRRTKYIEWIVFSDEPLVTSTKRISGTEILHNGKRLGDPQFVSLTVYNLSREAITQGDFETPITVTFPNGTVVSVATSTNSEDFTAEASVDDEHTVILQPLLMNYFDKVTLRFLIDGSTNDLDLRTRIVGQTRQARRGYLESPSKDSSLPWSLWARMPQLVRLALILIVVLLWAVNAVAFVVRSFG